MVGADKNYTIREKLVYLGRHIDRSYEKVIPLLKELRDESADSFEQIIEIFKSDGLRSNIRSFSQFDGLIRSAAALETIKSQLGDAFIYDVQKLERFAGCPLRFLFDDLIGLKPDYILDYHPDFTERGILVRRILTDYSRAAAPSAKIPEDASQILKQGRSCSFEYFV